MENLNRPLHLIRYGIAREAQYLSGDFARTYDALVFNGSTAAYMPSALTSFLASKVFGKRFLIDPMTHVFQHPVHELSSRNTGAPRKSVQKLAAALGDPAAAALGNQTPLSPKDFDDSNIDLFVNRVVSFQAEGFLRSAEDSGDVEYFEYLGLGHALQPYFIVAPYFFMGETSIGQWWELNLELLRRTVSVVDGRFRVICQVVVDQGSLEASCLDDFISGVRESDAWGVGVWVDNLDETSASAAILGRYIRMINGLGSAKPVILLYGSYFPVVLSHSFPTMNIAGVCHSLEYGEWRPVVPVGGGLPVSKFYFPSLHARVPFVESLRLASQYLTDATSYLTNVCSCPVCRDLIGRGSDPISAYLRYGETRLTRVVRQGQDIDRNFPTMAARDLCVSHYLFCKDLEYRTKVTPDEAVYRLQQSGQWATETMRSSSGKHCLIWANAISDASHVV